MQPANTYQLADSSQFASICSQIAASLQFCDEDCNQFAVQGRARLVLLKLAVSSLIKLSSCNQHVASSQLACISMTAAIFLQACS